MAAMLRLLMLDSPNTLEARIAALSDPDWWQWDLRRVHFYQGEYLRLFHQCLDAGVPVIQHTKVF